MGVNLTSDAKLGLRWPKVLIGLILAVGGAALVADLVNDQRRAEAEERRVAAFWTVAGPPCAALSDAEAARSPVRLRRGFEFEGAQFLRGYGDVSCRQFKTKVSETVGAELVCQFTGPTQLQAITEKGAANFAVGPGPATLAIRDGAATCVRAARLKPGVAEP